MHPNLRTTKRLSPETYPPIRPIPDGFATQPTVNASHLGGGNLLLMIRVQGLSVRARACSMLYKVMRLCSVGSVLLIFAVARRKWNGNRQDDDNCKVKVTILRRPTLRLKTGWHFSPRKALFDFSV